MNKKLKPCLLGERRKVGRKDKNKKEMHIGDIVVADFAFYLGGNVMGKKHAIDIQNGVLGGICLNYDNNNKKIKLTKENRKRYFQRIDLLKNVKIVGKL